MGSRLPPSNSETAGFWEHAAREELAIQVCSACGHRQFFPRSLCTECMATDLQWQAVSGLGTLHSFSVVFRPPHSDFADRVPYVVAVVDLDEGVRMFSNVVGVRPEAVRVGQRLRVAFREEADGRKVPVFTTLA